MTGMQRVCAAALTLVGLWAGAVATTLWGPAWHVAEADGVEVYHSMDWPAVRIVVLAVVLAILALSGVFVVLACRRGATAPGDRWRPALVVGLAFGLCAGPIFGLLGFVLMLLVLPPAPSPTGV